MFVKINFFLNYKQFDIKSFLTKEQKTRKNGANLKKRDGKIE